MACPMATTLSVQQQQQQAQSRRKQTTPQRLAEDEAARGLNEALIRRSLEMQAAESHHAPIDLSKKAFDELLETKPVLEDKSNLLQQLGLNFNPQLIALCAQLTGSSPEDFSAALAGNVAAVTAASLSTDDGDLQAETSSTPAASATPPSRSHESRQCPSENCGEVLPSLGALAWHVEQAHQAEKLFECAECGDRVEPCNVLSHRCASAIQRPVSVVVSEVQNDENERRKSAPPGVDSMFSLIEPSNSPDEAPSLPFLNSLFSSKPGFTPDIISAMDLTATSSSSTPTTPHPSQIFPGFSGIPPSAFPGLPPGMPNPFMMRPPFPSDRMMGPDVFQRDVLANEDDWESLMEVSNTDENEKIRALVGDKALPTTDPNQCILCRRVLSCKSALQMHYRTHTGERPFKCKICQRAFTTKGNLKTHMGVHRAKHPIRGLSGMGPPLLSPAQQCPICQKRFLSGPQLQAHIAEHTSQLHSNGFAASSPSKHQPKLPPGFDLLPPGFPMLPFPFPPLPSFMMPPAAPVTSPQPQTPVKSAVASVSSPTPFNLAAMLGLATSEPEKRPPSPIRTPSTTPAPEKSLFAALAPNFAIKMEPKPDKQDIKTLNDAVSPSSSSLGSAHDQTDGSSVRGESSEPEEKKPCLEKVESTPPKLEIFEVPKLDPSEKRPSENPLEAMQKMWAEANTEPSPPRQMPVLSKHQCGVCFKHFSSSSALQIHMRTHTGDKPFKCETCGRAFTTRGNLKVHMGTHSWSQSPSRRGRRIFDATPPQSSAGPAGLPLPGFPFPFGPPGAGGALPSAANVDNVMLMLMRTVCTVCHKICGSASELEQHLKGHISSFTPPTSATAEAVAK